MQADGLNKRICHQLIASIIAHSIGLPLMVYCSKPITQKSMETMNGIFTSLTSLFH